jgi:surfeit locus 1 family protein
MRLSVVLAALFGLVGTAALIGLGVWQLQRLEWKEGLIAKLEARLAAAPVAVPAVPDPEHDSFLRVRAAGRIGARELDVLTSHAPYGPGFRVIAPLTEVDGRRLLVDLGYVPEAEKKVAGPRFAGPVEVTGALYWPDETDSFTPAPDRKANIWFARDVAPMAEALGTEPLLVVAESVSPQPPGRDWPKPLRLGVNLPNDHLQYAITWFALALVWAVMTTVLVRREWRRSP